MSSARLLKGLLAIAIAIAPIGQSTAQQATHFYRVPIPGVDALPPANPNGPALTAGNYGSTTVGTNQAFTLAAPSVAGGTAPYAFSAVALPAGMILQGNGSITGSIATPGTYAGSVTVTDSSTPQKTASAAFSVTVTAPPAPGAVAISLNGSIPAEAMVGVAIPAVTASATGGVSPYAFSAAGTPPNGVTVTGNTLSGTPTQAGTFTYGIQVSDSQSTPSTQSATGTTLVHGPLSASLTGTPAQTVQEGTAIAPVTISATGGKAPYVYSVNTIPVGMTFSGGVLAGAPSVAGTYSISLTATESFAAQSTTLGPYTLTVTATPAQPLAIAANPVPASEAIIGTPIAASTFSHTGGTGTVTYDIIGSAPNGIGMSGATLQGTPLAGSADNYNFLVRGTDSGSPAQSETTMVAMTVYDTFSAAPNSTPQTTATIGTAISPVTINATGGKEPYVFGNTGSLPNGVSVNQSTGILSGVPMQIGTFNYRLTATHSFSGAQVLQTSQYTLTVNDTPAIAIAPATPQAHATRNTAITPTNLNPSGGNGQYTFALVGNPPPGLGFTGNQLTGTPTTNGDYSFQIRVTDTTPGTPKTVLSSSTYLMSVRDPVLVTSTALTNATANVAYSFQLTASGGQGPYTFSVAGLPATLSPVPSNGLISGTPTTAQTFTSLMVTATDSVGRTHTAINVTLTVLPPPPAAIPRPNSFTLNEGAWVGNPTGIDGLYDASSGTQLNASSPYEFYPRTPIELNYTTANKANCAVVGIQNNSNPIQVGISFRIGSNPIGSLTYTTFPSGDNTRTILLTGATGTPDVNKLVFTANGPHNNYRIHTFKPGAWDGTTCLTSS